MTQSFGRECLLLKNVLNRGSVAGQIPAEMDSIMRAWVYYRMLTDRVEAVYHREKVNYILQWRNGETGKRGNREWRGGLWDGIELLGRGFHWTGFHFLGEFPRFVSTFCDGVSTF